MLIDHNIKASKEPDRSIVFPLPEEKLTEEQELRKKITDNLLHVNISILSLQLAYYGKNKTQEWIQEVARLMATEKKLEELLAKLNIDTKNMVKMYA